MAHLTHKVPLLRRLFHSLVRTRVKEKVVEIATLITTQEKIIDIGAGNCVVGELLQERGYSVTAYDIQDTSLSPTLTATLYDGVRLPVEDHFYDVALLVTVLHHTSDPLALVKEASRVAKRVLIIEEVYTNPLNKYLTFLIDSLFNSEFLGHPHSNKTDAEWRQCFARLDLTLIEARYRRSLAVLRRVTYLLGQADQPGPAGPRPH